MNTTTTAVRGDISTLLSDIDETARFLAKNYELLLLDPDQIKQRSSSALHSLFTLGNGTKMSADLDCLECIYTDGMDSEQIWGQVELRNDSLLRFIDAKLDGLDAPANLDEAQSDAEGDFDVEAESGAESDIGLEGESNVAELEMPNSDDYESTGESEAVAHSQPDSELDDDEEIDEEIDEDAENDQIAEDQEEISKDQDGLDDQFFSMAEFDRFGNGDLEDEDFDYTKDPDEMQAPENEDSDSDDDQEPREVGDEDDRNDMLMYSDFFLRDDKKAADEAAKKKPEFRKRPRARKDKNADEAEDFSDFEIPQKELFNNESDQDDGESIVNETSVQRKAKKMKQTIAALENGNIKDKDWQLIGEVAGKGRPLNSMLEEDLDFDVAAKPVPIVTEEVTKSLEDLIKQRIKDESWDDVERRYAPSDKAKKEREFIELDDAKPKESLAQVYETEYQKKVEEAQGKPKVQEVLPEHIEVEALFKELCYKLDALSNWHYTPKPVLPEMKIVPKDTSAIEMEEVIPVAVSDAQLQAPGEVYAGKKNDTGLKTQEDLTSKDKTKLRREQKLKNQKTKKTQERESKILKKANPGMGNKHSKSKILKDLVGNDAVTLIGADVKKPKRNTTKTTTSSAFLKL